jgi:hypothetical protein
MRSTLKVLVAQLAFVLAFASPALATQCCTMQPNCEGIWTATADVFSVVCFRVNYVDGQKANFCLQRGQTRQVKVRSGDTVSFWATRAVSVEIESGFPRGAERRSLGGRFGFWDAP